VQLLERNYKDRAKMVRVISNFALCLIKNKMIKITEFDVIIKEFSNHFK
jgi:hypothetical protein